MILNVNLTVKYKGLLLLTCMYPERQLQVDHSNSLEEQKL